MVLQRLINLLPFGEVIPSSRFEEFVTQDLPSIADAAQEQLLYWHLADHPTLNNHPVESLLLWTKDDYFWFITVPPRREELIETIRRGERVRFLERFRLDHTEVQVSFQELRLKSHAQGHRLVITEGKEFTYKWADVSRCRTSGSLYPRTSSM